MKSGEKRAAGHGAPCPSCEVVKLLLDVTVLPLQDVNTA
jgi:hypothetical protein